MEETVHRSLGQSGTESIFSDCEDTSFEGLLWATFARLSLSFAFCEHFFCSYSLSARGRAVI